MEIRIIDVVLACILCFLTGAAAMLWYTQLTEKPQEPPVVNVYVITSDKGKEVKIESDEGAEVIIEKPEVKKKWYSEEDIVNMAKMCYGESMGVPSLDTVYGERSNAYQNACAMYTVLNRVDAGYGDISTCIKAKNQFIGYKSSNPVDDRLYRLAVEVIDDWATGEEILRVLPPEYLYFRGDGRHNYFRTQDGTKYDWSIPDPFE